MASNTGYEGSTTPTVGYFSKEQRARLESVTFARILLMRGLLLGRSPTMIELFQLAEYINRGDVP